MELKETIRSLPGGLDTTVSECGSNFSSGQRQLVCLARAILKNNKILILDEATANIDTEYVSVIQIRINKHFFFISLRTDKLIQTTIRNKFYDCTILTVAHRINTVMDNDRIMVLDAGKIVEFDAPNNLLRNKQGAFSKLVNEAGLLEMK